MCLFFYFSELGSFVALYWQWIFPPRFLFHIQDVEPTGIASFLPKTRFHGCSRWSGFLDFAACLCECLGRHVIWCCLRVFFPRKLTFSLVDGNFEISESFDACFGCFLVRGVLVDGWFLLMVG